MLFFNPEPLAPRPLPLLPSTPRPACCPWASPARTWRPPTASRAIARTPWPPTRTSRCRLEHDAEEEEEEEEEEVNSQCKRHVFRFWERQVGRSRPPEALEAQKNGWFKEEIVPVTVETKQKDRADVYDQSARHVRHVEWPVFQEATSNKCHASSNKCLTSSNKKLVVTSALLVVTRS